MRDEPDGAGSEDLVVAGPQVAAHMSEKQAIISELRACGKQSLPKAELLSTPNFQALIVRLGTAQHEPQLDPEAGRCSATSIVSGR